MNIEELIPKWIGQGRDAYIESKVLDQVDYIGVNGQWIYFKFKVDKEVFESDVIRCGETFLINITKDVWELWSDDPNVSVPKKYLLEVWEKQQISTKINKTYIITEQDINIIKNCMIRQDDTTIDDILENLNELPTPKKLDINWTVPDDFYTNRHGYGVKIELDENMIEFSKFIEDNNFIKPEQPYYVGGGEVLSYSDLREIFLESVKNGEKE